MKPRVYIETSIVSYLTAQDSRDIIRTAQQQVTREWWAAREKFSLFISQFVIDEASAGDEGAAARRLSALATCTLLEVSDDVVSSADHLIGRGGLPASARLDALHIAVAAVHGLDFLLTWNCKHIANASLRSKIEGHCRLAGFEPPVICTPMEFAKE